MYIYIYIYIYIHHCCFQLIVIPGPSTNDKRALFHIYFSLGCPPKCFLIPEKINNQFYNNQITRLTTYEAQILTH